MQKFLLLLTALLFSACDNTGNAGCSHSLADACAQLTCAPQLSSAEQLLCGADASPGLRGFIWTSPCDGYRAVIEAGVDTARVYYYDARTQELVAVVGTGLVKGDQCIGGPADFRIPTECASSTKTALCAAAPDGGQP
jgi:hypothetical protein